MSSDLETRAVFIDTQEFFRRNFDIEGSELASLKQLARQGKIRLVLTDVTVRELEAQIEKKYREFAEPLAAAMSKTRLLRNLSVEIPGVRELSSELKTGVYLDALKTNFREFLAATGAEVLEVSKASPGAVFDLYFDRRPPFGKDKKKHEFPDAFALATLRIWCEENGKKIYVISGDGDMKAACDEAPEWLIHSESLPEFLELVLHEEADIGVAHIRFAKVRSKVEELAKAKFENLPVLLRDEEGEGWISYVARVLLTSESVVSLSDGSANFSLSAEFTFEAEVEYTSHYTGTSHWTIVTGTEEVPVEVAINFDPSDVNSNKVAQVVVNSGEPIPIYLSTPVE